MATCKDCIGNDYCFVKPLHPRMMEKSCKKFKNKADYAEVKHGEWRETTQFVISDDPDDDGYWRTIYICSECERTAINKEPYCHCGAKMDGVRKEEG